MKITCCTQDGRVTEIEVGESATFEDIKAILSVEFKTTPDKLTLSYKGDTSIPDSETVGNQGLADKDMLLAIVANPQQRVRRNPPPAQQTAQTPAQGAQPAQGAGQAMDPGIERALNSLLPPHLRGLDFGRIFAPPSPQDAEEQRQQQAAIDENYQLAMQESPESFTPVYMLYIDVEINGVAVKAFVDSGAQSTVMSKACAERTGVIGLVDPRFAGVAVGVGSARIIGKVHLAPVKIGDTYYNCSFSVLDQVQNVELLIGLDLLKKYQCNIDLMNDCLRIGTTDQTIPFLPEAELPAHARLH